MATNKKYTWLSIFLNLALRAVIKAHHRYSVWHLGQENISLENFAELNQGKGISFASEEHIRDEISHQIIESGLWKEHYIEGELRSYNIDREFKVKIPVKEFKEINGHDKFNIPSKQKNKKFNIDIVFKRIQDKNDKDDTPTLPVFIEAKRYNLVNINVKSKIIKEGKFQKKGIDKDILKLKILSEYNKKSKIIVDDKTYDEILTYILIWGISDKEFSIKDDLINKLDNSGNLGDSEIIKYPIKWNDTSNTIESFLWIALLEVNP